MSPIEGGVNCHRGNILSWKQHSQHSASLLHLPSSKEQQNGLLSPVLPVKVVINGFIYLLGGVL